MSFGLDASGWLHRPDPALAQRMGGLDAEIAALRSGAGGIDQRLTAVEQRPVPAQPDLVPLQQAATGLRDDLTAQHAVLETLRDGLAKQADSADLARASTDQAMRELRETVSGLSLSLAEQRSRIDTLVAQRPDLQPLTAGIQDARKVLAAQEGKLADLAARVAMLEGTLAGARAAAADTARLALAMVELDRALTAGEPLAAALEPFAPLAADPGVAGPLEQLRPLRSEGAPTIARLQANLAGLRPRITEAVRFEGSSGWLDRTAQNLAGLVDLRRGDDGASGTVAELDKAEQALAQGDVEAAVGAMRPLADAGNAGAAEWVAQAGRRLDGFSAMDRLRSYLSAHMPAPG
ncbi:MAG TPA: hypothetical protein PKA13_09975 [Geminicoccaceae bacterium]|nr:hypothetical protein [Geminicoccaceae bacterium]